MIIRRYCGGVTGLPSALSDVHGSRCLQRTLLQDPRAIGQGMLRSDLAAIDGEAQRACADAKERGSTREVQPSFGTSALCGEARD